MKNGWCLRSAQPVSGAALVKFRKLQAQVTVQVVGEQRRLTTEEGECLDMTISSMANKSMCRLCFVRCFCVE